MLISMVLDSEDERSAYYSFCDGEIGKEQGIFRIDKIDFDASEIIYVPVDMDLTYADVKKGMAKVIRQAIAQGCFSKHVIRAY